MHAIASIYIKPRPINQGLDLVSCMSVLSQMDWSIDIS